MKELNDAIRQNLIDAGCNEETIKSFSDSSNSQERLRILATQRNQLLESYHSDARKLECLDYLIYQLKKESME